MQRAGELSFVRRASFVDATKESLAVACVLPDNIDSRALRDTLLAKHGIIVKMAEKRQFNGFRLSPHILNSELHIDTALEALKAEIG